MIDFEEELKKFKPSLEVYQADEAISQNDLRDVMDLFEEMMRDASTNRKNSKNR